VDVPFVCKTFDVLSVCTGSNALRALVADVCPVPPFVKGRGVPGSNPALTLKSLSAIMVHISPKLYILIIPKIYSIKNLM